MDIKIEDTDINELLNETLYFFLPEADRKGLKFTCTKILPSTSRFIRTDSIKVNQILANLVNNALKYTRSGSIGFGCKLQENKVIFFVKDTGIGIQKDIQSKIFDRFRQGDLAAADSSEGCGLGLSISKAYVKALGGNIWVESQPKKGSTFYFSLPFEPADFAKEKMQSYAVRNSFTDKEMTILVAEDDGSSYDYIKELLTNRNITLLHSENGKEAIHMCQTHPEINLVLMDIKMAPINGLDATRQIKKIRPDLPVIAQTAYAMPKDKVKVIEAGCSDYIVKPIKSTKLFSILDKYNH